MVTGEMEEEREREKIEAWKMTMKNEEERQQKRGSMVSCHISFSLSLSLSLSLSISTGKMILWSRRDEVPLLSTDLQTPSRFISIWNSSDLWLYGSSLPYKGGAVDPFDTRVYDSAGSIIRCRVIERNSGRIAADRVQESDAPLDKEYGKEEVSRCADDVWVKMVQYPSPDRSGICCLLSHENGIWIASKGYQKIYFMRVEK
jgi:hypothetical protein